MRIASNVFCQIHRSKNCCGREPRKFPKRKFTPRYGEPKNRKWVPVKPGIFHQVDPHHPRGYRVRLSHSRMVELLNQKVLEQDRLCCICNQRMEDLREVGPQHKEPSSMGGAWRDDHPDNIGAAHNACNLKLGSRRAA
jgi:hypothetical protein